MTNRERFNSDKVNRALHDLLTQAGQVDLTIVLKAPASGEVIGHLNRLGMSPPIHTAVFKAHMSTENAARLSWMDFLDRLEPLGYLLF